MTKNQYENIISETIKNESADKSGLDTVRNILKNLGIGFPKGDVDDILAALETDDFMGWRKCDGNEAAEAVNNGTPVIAIRREKICVIAGEKGESGLVTTQDDLLKDPGVLMYMYSGDTTEEPSDYPIAERFNGRFFIRNATTGKYLRYLNGSVSVVTADSIYNLTEYDEWVFTYMGGNDYCYISPYTDSSKHLCISGNSVILSQGDVPGNVDNTWYILDPDDGTYFIRSSAGSRYLANISDNIIHANFPATGTNWTFTTVSEVLSMPQNLNQKYIGNDINIQNFGCCVCCACDTASYYAGYEYSLDDMAEAGVFIPCSIYDPGNGCTGDATCIYTNVPSASFIETNIITNYLNKICDEIRDGQPIMVHMGDSNHSHYVLAYGFTNNGRSTSDIMVLDPYNPDTSSPVGAYRSLRDAIDVEIVAIYGNNANLTDYDVCGLVYTELKD